MDLCSSWFLLIWKQIINPSYIDKVQAIGFTQGFLLFVSLFYLCILCISCDVDTDYKMILCEIFRFLSDTFWCVLFQSKAMENNATAMQSRCGLVI